MCEEPWRVTSIGSTGVDRLMQTVHLEKSEVMRRLGLEWGGNPYVLVIQHPTIHDVGSAGGLMKDTLEAIRENGVRAAIIYPNSDPGTFDVIQEIEEFTGSYPKAAAFKNLPRDTFVNLMRHADAMVGNSSAGVIEAPTFGLPVVNVGIRQRGRERGENVQFVDNNQSDIKIALRKALSDKKYRSFVRGASSPYGKGDAGERAAEILLSAPDRETLLFKRQMFRDA